MSQISAEKIEIYIFFVEMLVQLINLKMEVQLFRSNAKSGRDGI